MPSRYAPRGRSPMELKINRYAALTAGAVAGLLLGWILLETVDTMMNGAPIDSAGAPAAFRVAQSTPTLSTGSTIKETAKAVHRDMGATTNHVAGDTIHSVITSSGSGYQNWQGRIMYGTYKLVQEMPGGEKLTGFTRILHRVHEDECMDEIPTFHANPLHPECDTWCDFPVADRPNAVQQWVDYVKKDPTQLKGAWVAVLECDYVWMKPLKAPGDAFTSTLPGEQFQFGYINAQYSNNAKMLKRLDNRVDPQRTPNSGPAPALLRFSDLEKVTPLWEEFTAKIEADEEAVKVLGWVREMYAWDMGINVAGVEMKTLGSHDTPLIVQPPDDHSFYNAAMCHYTWGAEYNDSEKKVWSWDKRVYTDAAALKPELIPMPPTWEEGKYHLQDFFQRAKVPKDQHDTLAAMLEQMNKAIVNLPDLTAKFNALPKN